MPSTEIEMSDKKHKKSKKIKQVAAEEEMDQQQQEEEPKPEVTSQEEDHEDEKPKKKKKKNKAKSEAVEEEAAEESESKPADDETQETAGGENEEAEEEIEIDESAVEKVFKQLEGVEESLLNAYKPVAQKLSRKFKNDPLVPLSAAIVVLSGANKRKANKMSKNGGGDGCSLLTQREGYTTYLLTKNGDEIRGKSFAYVIIKRILGEEEGDQAISHIKFTKDQTSLIFDIPSSYDETIAEKWYSTPNLELKALTGDDTLPEVEEGSSGGGGGGGGRGGGGGFGGGRGRGGGRGGFGGRGGGGFGGRGGGGRGGGGFGGRGGGGFGGRGGGGFGRGGGGGGGDRSNKKIKFDD